MEPASSNSQANSRAGLVFLKIADLRIAHSLSLPRQNLKKEPRTCWHRRASLLTQRASFSRTLINISSSLSMDHDPVAVFLECFLAQLENQLPGAGMIVVRHQICQLMCGAIK